MGRHGRDLSFAKKRWRDSRCDPPCSCEAPVDPTRGGRQPQASGPATQTVALGGIGAGRLRTTGDVELRLDFSTIQQEGTLMGDTDRDEAGGHDVPGTPVSRPRITRCRGDSSARGARTVRNHVSRRTRRSTLGRPCVAQWPGAHTHSSVTSSVKLARMAPRAILAVLAKGERTWRRHPREAIRTPRN